MKLGILVIPMIASVMWIASPAGSQAEPSIGKRVVVEMDADAYPLEVVEPAYPMDMRRQGISGQALVKAHVSSDGVPVKVELISANWPSFGESAIKAVKKWFFEPARVRGVGVSQSVIIPIRFIIVEEGLDGGKERVASASSRGARGGAA